MPLFQCQPGRLIYCLFAFQEDFYAKDKTAIIIFTAITAFITVYGMTLYNTVLAYFVSSRFAKEFAFKVVKPADSKIYFQTYI